MRQLDSLLVSHGLGRYKGRSEKLRLLIVNLSNIQAAQVVHAATWKNIDALPCNVDELIYPDDIKNWLEIHFPNNRELQLEFSAHMIAGHAETPSDWKEAMEAVRRKAVEESKG
jgi:hypothetical protein